MTFLLLYVDDILLLGNDVPMLQENKESLERCFAMKDLGEAAFILGIRICSDRSRRLIGLSQSAYIDKVLKRFNMDAAKKGVLPLSHKFRLSKTQNPMSVDERSRMDKIPYASAAGSIMYAMICTRSDVCYDLNITSIYQSDPGESH